jgi:UDP-N-acetylmuramate dehydrogenase
MSACHSMRGSEFRFSEELISHVQRLVVAPVRERVPGSDLSTFAIGGGVRALVTIESEVELSAVVSLLAREGQDYRVIGNGSNVLFGDGELSMWLLKLGGGFRRTESRNLGVIEVLGGVPLMSFARRVSSEGLSGLEFAAGIPATVGGAVFMNAGAHGAEICDRIVEIRGVLPDGSLHTWSRGDLPWTYRRSGLPAGAVVSSVVLSLVEGDRAKIAEACAHNLAERRARQPLSLPSAGSVFKNPSVEQPAGMLLERLGMKGFSVGGAMISEMHANWIVNPKRKATARDVVAVIQACQERARQEAGIELEPEVRLWLDNCS